jgi:uncharacterized RDD family membrane protein YckC
MLASFYIGPIQFGPLNSVPIDLMSPRNAIDLTATITTPENIQFEYRIAGPFRRIPAFLVDLLVRIVAFLAMFMAVACSGITQLFPFLSQFATIGVVILLTYFLIDWFYGVFFETYWNGRTIGKWISKIQVISVDGRPISAYQATIRNFLRLADLAPMMSLAAIFANDAPPFLFPTGLVAILCMVFTTRFQRLGDLAAGTMVVVDERAWVPPKVKLEDPRVASLSELIPANFMMSRSMVRAVALYAERRMRMPMARRMELSAILAAPLMAQLGLREDTSPDLFLCALYYREFVAKPIAITDSTSVDVGIPISQATPVQYPAGPNPVSHESNSTPPPDLAPYPQLSNGQQIPNGDYP